MRTHAALEARQKALDVFVPHVTLHYYSSGPPHDGGGSWVRFDKLGDVSRHRVIENPEEVYGADIIIKLDNSAGSYDSYDLEGLWISVGWGAIDTDGETELASDYDDDPPPQFYWVKRQWWESDTEEGIDYYCLYVLGGWSKLAQYIFKEDHDSSVEGDAIYDKTIKGMISAILDEAGMALGTSISECSMVDSANWKPVGFTISAEEDARAVVKRLLDLCKSRLVSRADKMCLKKLDAAESKCYDYKTSDAHKLRQASASSAMFRPMKITVSSIDGNYTHTWTHPKYQAGMGEVTYTDLYGFIDSNEDAQFLAEAIGEAAESQADSGYIHCRTMNCLQEVYDVVQATDDMGNTSMVGRIGRIYRRFYPLEGIYDMQIDLGGLMRVMPSSMEDLVSAVGITSGISGQSLQRWSVNPEVFRRGIQGYKIYTASDWTSSGIANVAWPQITVKFDDGTSLLIDSGIKSDLTGSHFAYFIEGNSTLKWTTDIRQTSGKNRGLVAVAVKGVAGDSKCYLRVAEGKDQIYIASMMAVDYLSAIAANIGQLILDEDGELRLGNGGTPGSNFSGIRIYRDSGTYRVEGQDSGDIQAYMGSDGKIMFGEDAGYLDKDGLHMSEAIKGNVSFVVSDIFSGNGSGTSRHITTGFKCQCVILWGEEFCNGIAEYAVAFYFSDSSHQNFFVRESAQGDLGIFLHATDGFYVGTGVDTFNVNGKAYHYVAFG